MRWWLYVVCGVLAYLFFLVASLPIPHAINLLASSGLPISIGQSSGSIWDGEASQVSYSNVTLGPAKWQFRPLGLFQGKFKYWFEFNSPENTLLGYIAKDIGYDRFTLSDIKGLIRADSLLRLSEQSNIGAIGQLELELQELQLTKQQITSAHGEIRWLDAGIQHPFKAELGNLQFILYGDEKIIKSSVKDLDGPLKIDGELSLLPDGNYRVQGKVKSINAANQGLVSLLQSIGRPIADGSIQIAYSGRL